MRRIMYAVAVLSLSFAGDHAEAATYRYDYKVEYLGTTFHDIQLETDDGRVEYVRQIGPGENTYGIPEVLPSLNVGDIIRFTARLYRPDSADDFEDTFNIFPGLKAEDFQESC